MEALAALRLNLSPRRHRPDSNKFYEDESAPSSPYYLSAPTSPRRFSLREVEETPLGEVLAAIPFEWELKPGTPKRGRGSRKGGDITSDSIGVEELESRSRSPSPERLSRQSSTSDFDFSSARFIAEEDTHALSDDVNIASADQLFFHGQLLPLRLPPRLQAVKHLGESPASSCPDGTTIHGSFRKPVSPRSGNSTMKLMSFRGRSKSPHREARDAVVWPVEEVDLGPKSGPGAKLQKFRSLSPLRIFKRENSEVSILFSDKSPSGCESASSSASSSASTAFSSSSSGDENSNLGINREFWPSFEEKQRNGRSTVTDFLYSDKPFASPKIDISKLSSKEVLSKADRFKASEEGLKSVPSKKELEAAKQEKTLERKRLTPQLSRSNARSISRTTRKKTSDEWNGEWNAVKSIVGDQIYEHSCLLEFTQNTYRCIAGGNEKQAEGFSIQPNEIRNSEEMSGNCTTEFANWFLSQPWTTQLPIDPTQYGVTSEESRGVIDDDHSVADHSYRSELSEDESGF